MRAVARDPDQRLSVDYGRIRFLGSGPDQARITPGSGLNEAQSRRLALPGSVKSIAVGNLDRLPCHVPSHRARAMPCIDAASEPEGELGRILDLADRCAVRILAECLQDG